MPSARCSCAAGAYHSPQLLMLSGIGPADHLAPMGIEVRADLPVGENLQDHPVCSLQWLSNEPSMLSAFSPEAAAQYEADASGPLSSNVGEGCTFLRSRPDLPAPDLQFIFGPLHLHEEFLGVITDDAYFFGPALVKPTSRGRVTLRSPVFHAKPRILHNYLGTEEDRRAMIEGMRIAMDVGERPALDSARGERFAYPASDSDADIMDFVQRRTHTVYHPVSTCSIGPGRGQRAAGARHRRAARRGCLGHAVGAARQHERAGDHGRREGRGHDPRAGPAAARRRGRHHLIDCVP